MKKFFLSILLLAGASAQAAYFGNPQAVVHGGTATSNRTLTDSSSGVSHDWENRLLEDASAVNSINYQARALFDASAVSSIQYQSRLLQDAAGTSVVLWNAYELDNDLGVKTLGWADETLFHDNGGSPISSLNWNTGAMSDNSSVLSQNWKTRVLADGTGATVVDYSASQLKAGAFGVVAWGSQAMNDSSGVSSIAWTARSLRNTAGAEVLSYTSQQAVYDSTSPTTTKGDLIVDDGTNVIRVGVGTDGNTLRANSGAAAGVSWSALDLAGGSNFVTGVLPLANGGTNKNMTASNGAVAYSDADSLELTTVGVSGQVLTSNGAAAPTWETPTAAAAFVDSLAIDSNLSAANGANQFIVGSGAGTDITLFDCTASEIGYEVTLKRNDGTNSITLQPDAGDDIDGSGTGPTLSTNYDSFTVVCATASHWFIK